MGGFAQMSAVPSESRRGRRIPWAWLLAFGSHWVWEPNLPRAVLALDQSEEPSLKPLPLG